MQKGNYSKNMGLEQWQQMLKEIYFPTQNYGRDAHQTLIHLYKVFGAGSRNLFRTRSEKGSKKYLAKIFAWYCALGTRLGVNIADALWEKYPNACPRCLKDVCECKKPLAEIDPEKLGIIAQENAYKRPKTLGQWQTMFGNLYRSPDGNREIVPEQRMAMIFSRMAEELGEIAEAILLDPVIDLDVHDVVRNELADFGAWIFALANNLQNVDPSMDSVTLADAAWQLYPGTCHRCLAPKCICVRGSYAMELAEKGAMGPSHWDELTGLGNVNGLRQYLRRMDAEFQRGQTVSIIFLDLDNFGKVNKDYSHIVGDEVLRQAAKRIKDAVGSDGIPFRRGGEEFMVVSRLRSDFALVTAETIRRALEEPIKAEHQESAISLTVTASIGVASSTDTSIVKPSQLEEVAEQRAGEAKRSGKNTVVPTVTKDLILQTRKFKFSG